MCKMTAENVRVECLISDRNGVYIPKMFGEMFKDGPAICNKKGEEDTDLTDLVNSFADREPDSEGYWEDWEQVLNTVYLLGQGDEDCFPNIFSLHQDGDLKAVNEQDLSELDQDEQDKFWNNMTC